MQNYSKDSSAKSPYFQRLHENLFPPSEPGTPTALQRNSRSRSLFSNFGAVNQHAPGAGVGASCGQTVEEVHLVKTGEARMSGNELELEIEVECSSKTGVGLSASTVTMPRREVNWHEGNFDDIEAAKSASGSFVQRIGKRKTKFATASQQADSCNQTPTKFARNRRSVANLKSGGDISSPLKSSSFRSGFTSYLANKLSILTNLGGGGGGGGTVSTPSSPALTMPSRRKQQTSRAEIYTTAPSTPAKHMLDGTSATAAATNHKWWPAFSQASLFDQTMAAIAQASRDFGGCDFVLLLDASKPSAICGGANANAIARSKSGSAAATAIASGTSQSTTNAVATMTSAIGSSELLATGGGGGKSRAGSCSSTAAVAGSAASVATGTAAASSAANSNEHHSNSAAHFGSSALASTLIIHLVAPNLQEKAAWMSDISQVSRRSASRIVSVVVAFDKDATKTISQQLLLQLLMVSERASERASCADRLVVGARAAMLISVTRFGAISSPRQQFWSRHSARAAQSAKTSHWNWPGACQLGGSH